MWDDEKTSTSTSKTPVPKSGELQGGLVWFERKNSTVTLGLTNAAIEKVGIVESVEFGDVDSEAGSGEIVATITGSVDDLEVLSPGEGTLIEINTGVEIEPDLVSEDPLEGGWLAKVELQDRTDLLAALED